MITVGEGVRRGGGGQLACKLHETRGKDAGRVGVEVFDGVDWVVMR